MSEGKKPKVGDIVPRYFPGEEKAVAIVVAIADSYGYGNMINRLKDAWSEKLQREAGFTKERADAAGGHVCPWCDVDDRTGKKFRRRRKP